MGFHKYSDSIKKTVEQLSQSTSYKGLCHELSDGDPFPSGTVLSEIISLSRSLLFPGFFGDSIINTNTISYHRSEERRVGKAC